MDEEIRELERQLADETLDPQAAQRLRERLEILREWARRIQGLPPDHEAVRWFRRYAREIQDFLRRSRLARRLVRVLQRAGRVFGQVGKVAFRLQPSLAVEVFLTVLFYAPEAGESGSIAVPFDAYENVDTILIQEGDPEQGFKCYFACVYKLIGHFTKGDDPEKRLYHFEGDDNAPEIVMLHEYDCTKPPPQNQDICHKKIYIQVEF